VGQRHPLILDVAINGVVHRKGAARQAAFAWRDACIQSCPLVSEAADGVSVAGDSLAMLFARTRWRTGKIKAIIAMKNAADPSSRAMERDPVPAVLKRFIWDIQSMVELAESEREILVIGRDLMARLVENDDWLPTVFAVPNPAGGQQFQIYRDGLERFTVVSTILSGGTTLSIAQQSVWEIIGVLRGSVARRQLDCFPEERAQPGGGRLLEKGSVEARSSGSRAVSQLSNALSDRISIGIHVYGGEIGRLSRRSGAPGGRMDYANAENVPPYDIFSIQSDIRD
jgi:3-mercaptopropionate dioxygenase